MQHKLQGEETITYEYHFLICPCPGGRLRIKIPEVKGAPLKAREIERHLASCPGVEEVTASPITGSVLIHYNPRLIGQEEIIFVLQEIGYLEASTLKAAGGASGIPSHEGTIARVITVVASTLMEIALSSLVAAII
jgi:copper chaperone CopZ